MKILRLAALLLILLPAFAFSQAGNRAPVVLDSTNLPIVYVNTVWQFIANEPKIPIQLKIMDNGYNVMNHVTDPFNHYDGNAGIEKRGSISILFPQNSYALETRDSAGNELNVPMLGMPAEHDWILYAPYDDHTLMRNAMTYKLARQMGHWSPRTHFCELWKQEFAFLPSYHGVYLMTEKIKRDNDRVNISKMTANDSVGDDLSGGYIIAVDKNIWLGDSGFTTMNPPYLFIKYVYPKPDTITPQQVNYIRSYIDTVENALLAPNFADPATGFRKYLDAWSFVDFFIMTELSKNIDGFKRSAYMYKDKKSKDGRLKAGPYWDFNSAWWNAHACGFDDPAGWAYQMTCWVNDAYPVPFWWNRMLQDTLFQNQLNCRYTELRLGILSTSNIFGLIDSMATYVSASGADTRQFTRWDFTDSFTGQVDTLKWWISNRLVWMDANMFGSCVNPGIEEDSFESMLNVYPNPASEKVNITMNFNAAEQLSITMTDVLGKIVYVLPQQTYGTGFQRVVIPIEGFAPGMYNLRFSSKRVEAGKKLIISPLGH